MHTPCSGHTCLFYVSSIFNVFYVSSIFKFVQMSHLVAWRKHVVHANYRQHRLVFFVFASSLLPMAAIYWQTGYAWFDRIQNLVQTTVETAQLREETVRVEIAQLRVEIAQLREEMQQHHVDSLQRHVQVPQQVEPPAGHIVPHCQHGILAPLFCQHFHPTTHPSFHCRAATTTGHANAGKHYKAYRIVSLAALMELNWIKVSRRCHGFTSAEVVPGETPQSYGLVASDVRCAPLNCTLSTATICEHMMSGCKTIGSAGSFLRWPATYDWCKFPSKLLPLRLYLFWLLHHCLLHPLQGGLQLHGMHHQGLHHQGVHHQTLQLPLLASSWTSFPAQISHSSELTHWLMARMLHCL